ncbi:MAG: hypothetical protein HC866_21175 [Leptolyngbyaceae cyanobacterium RU_5_1]|nr:hypothetical protein [Leptolyngbyaceae cyanobacterium RU_5_1]
MKPTIYRIGIWNGNRIIPLPKSQEFRSHQRAIVYLQRLQRLMPKVSLSLVKQ